MAPVDAEGNRKPPSQPRPGLDKALVPGRPAGGRACRYYGLNDKNPLHLATSALLTPAQAATLAEGINVGSIAPGKEGTCPADEGSVDTLTFVYHTGPGVGITIRLTGCQFVSNGIVSSEYPSAEVTGQLSKLLVLQSWLLWSFRRVFAGKC